MTIKRRLFVSNILMIVIPLFVSLAVFFGGLYAFTSLTGIRDERRIRDGRVFDGAQQEMRHLLSTWGDDVDEARIRRDVDAFNQKIQAEWPKLLIFKDDVLISPAEMPILKTALKHVLRHRDEAMAFSGTLAYARPFGDYLAVLADSKLHVRSDEIGYHEIMWYGTILALVCSIFIILLTNRFLTQFVFKSITDSLDTLQDGVREIHNGNLAYRIDYRREDEFAGVCRAFNGMTARLEASVEAQARDEISRRELIAGISHDLRTPLTSIKAYVEGIEQGVAATPETQRRYLETIRNKTNDLEHIINMLFLFSKLDTGEFPYRIERVDIADVLAGTIRDVGDEYREKGLSIACSGETSHAPVEIDVVQFRSVLLNIFENSVKYGRAEGASLAIEATRANGTVEIALADNGPGVPPEAIDKIFDVFYRSDPSRRNPSRGSGLGLAIAARIVSHFGGSIRAHNADNGGLRIVITLPIAKENL